MKDAKTHPEALSEVNSIEITDDIKTLISNTARDVETEQANRSTWEVAIRKYIRLRYGIRDAKTNPWPNCANFSIPLSDADITRVKPAYVNLAYGVTPIVNYEPFGGEDIGPARKREVLFDRRMKTQVKFFEPYCYGIDKLLEQGATVFKTIWRFTTNKYTEFLDLEDLDQQVLQVLYGVNVPDVILFKIIQEELGIDIDFEENIKAITKAIEQFRAGKTKFELKLLEVKEDRPQVIARDLLEDLVIPFDTLLYEDNLDDARFIDDKIWTTKNDILIAMRDQKYTEYDDSEVDTWSNITVSKRRTLNTTAKTKSDLVLLHETCLWYDINDDGIQERCIATWPDAKPSMVLRFIELPYDHGQWPYTLVKRELNDPSVYGSRGVVALDEDFQIGISTALNQAIDNGTIVNTPKVVFKTNTLANVRNQRYIPGEPVETRGPTTDYEIRQQPNMSQGILFQQAQYLKSWADQRMGNTTSGLSQQNNLPGTGQQGNKTKAEIDLMAGLRNETQSLDLQVFQHQMQRVYYQIDALYEQFGNDEIELLITGEKPIKITRAEIQGQFHMVPNGKLDNSSPMQRANKAFNLMRIFAGDPDIRQYDLKQIFLNDYDYRIAHKIMLTPQEIRQRDKQQAMAQQAMMQQQEGMRQKMLGEQVQMADLKNKMDISKAAALEAVGGQATANLGSS